MLLVTFTPDDADARGRGGGGYRGGGGGYRGGAVAVRGARGGAVAVRGGRYGYRGGAYRGYGGYRGYGVGAAAVGAGRPKNAPTDAGLSDVDISHDKSSRWQKFAAIPEEIFEREVQRKTQSCRRLVNSDQSELLPKADAADKAKRLTLSANALYEGRVVTPSAAKLPH